MKFTSTQENLHAGISLVASLAGRAAGLPILNNVLLEAKGGVLIVSATNLEIGIKTEIRGKVEQEGSFTVNAKVFADYVTVLPSSHVTIEMIDNQLKVTCENFQTKIRGQKSDEFPIIPMLEEKESVEIEAKVLKQALSQTTFATSFDEMRPEINGVLFNVSQKNITLVATDSYRLAEKTIAIDKTAAEKSVIIPLKALQEVERVIGSHNEAVQIYFQENQVMFRMGLTVIVSRIIEGNFPNYQQIIPTGHSMQSQLTTSEMIQATRAAALFARTGINDINLQFKKNSVQVKTTNAQLGEQQTKLDAVTNGKDVNITFNYKYLLDGLQSVDGNTITLEVDSASSPVIMRDDSDKNFLYLIMPIKQ